MDVDMFFFFALITVLPFPLQNLVQGLRSQTPSSVSSTPNEVSAIPCEPLKNRDFFWYCEIFLPNTRGPLGRLLGFWPSGPKPCGGNNLGKLNVRFRDITPRLVAILPSICFSDGGELAIVSFRSLIKKFGSSSVALLRGTANSCQSKFGKSCWLDLRFRGDHEMVYHPQDILGKKV